MGFDLVGLNPKNEKGEYFRLNIIWWPQVWLYVCCLAGNVLTDEQQSSGYFNDGIEIDGKQCQAIVEILNDAIQKGWVKENENRLQELADKETPRCEACKGTGTKKNGDCMKDQKNVDCAMCEGTGIKDINNNPFIYFYRENESSNRLIPFIPFRKKP